MLYLPMVHSLSPLWNIPISTYIYVLRYSAIDDSGWFPLGPPTKNPAMHILVCAHMDTVCYIHVYTWNC